MSCEIDQANNTANPRTEKKDTEIKDTSSNTLKIAIMVIVLVVLVGLALVGIILYRKRQSNAIVTELKSDEPKIIQKLP